MISVHMPQDPLYHDHLTSETRSKVHRRFRDICTCLAIGVQMLLVFATNGCSGDTTGLPNYPRIVFSGRVVSPNDTGLQANVVLTQRYYGLVEATGETVPCSPDNWAFHRTARTDEAGRFEILHYPSFGLEGCFVLRVYDVQSAILMDSLVLTLPDLLERADSVTPRLIVVPVEIVVGEEIAPSRDRTHQT